GATLLALRHSAVPTLLSFILGMWAISRSEKPPSTCSSRQIRNLGGTASKASFIHPLQFRVIQERGRQRVAHSLGIRAPPSLRVWGSPDDKMRSAGQIFRCTWTKKAEAFLASPKGQGGEASEQANGRGLPGVGSRPWGSA